MTKLRTPLTVLLVAILMIGVFAAWSVSTPYSGFGAETTVVIKHGTGTLALGRELEQAGVVRSPWQFWLSKIFHPGAKLQAGEYRFTAAASANEVFSRIARGDIFYFELTVPEGSNMFDIARLLESRSIMSADAFLHAASDPALIQATIHDFSPHAKSLEGFLFPSTYRLSHSITPAQLCRLMTGEFRKEWTRLAHEETAPTNTDPNSTVTLASLVEKETGVAEERPLVASVFANRLNQKMRLQCDPTTIYAALLEHRYRGKIYASDLANTNPYNTYQNDGLPPGPIANPGAESLAAALHPATGNYLYFVAKPEGGSHNFSATLAQHGQAVAQYRNATQNQTQAKPH